MSFEKLFSPIKLRELELKNRVVMSAMGTHESSESEDAVCRRKPQALSRRS